MPLYTVRAVLSLAGETGRGSNLAVMSHHFESISDGGMALDLQELIDKYTQSGIADRWTCERGDATHELQLYRRDVTNERSFVHIATETFTLADWQTTTLTGDLQGVPIAVDITETPVFEHRRGAVLVIQTDAAKTVRKRTYVGPVSPVYYRSELAISIPLAPDIPAMFGVPGPGLDDPPQPGDSVDRWRLEIAQMAASHVQDLDGDMVASHSVLVSWKDAAILDVDETRASMVRGDLRSRGIREEMTGAAEDGF